MSEWPNCLKGRGENICGHECARRQSGRDEAWRMFSRFGAKRLEQQSRSRALVELRGGSCSQKIDGELLFVFTLGTFEPIPSGSPSGKEGERPPRAAAAPTASRMTPWRAPRGVGCAAALPCYARQMPPWAASAPEVGVPGRYSLKPARDPFFHPPMQQKGLPPHGAHDTLTPHDETRRVYSRHHGDSRLGRR